MPLLMVLCCQVVGIFGFTGEDHIGKISFPPVQVKAFSTFSWNSSSS